MSDFTLRNKKLTLFRASIDAKPSCDSFAI